MYPTWSCWWVWSGLSPYVGERTGGLAKGRAFGCAGGAASDLKPLASLDRWLNQHRFSDGGERNTYCPAPKRTRAGTQSNSNGPPPETPRPRWPARGDQRASTLLQVAFISWLCIGVGVSLHSVGVSRQVRRPCDGRASGLGAAFTMPPPNLCRWIGWRARARRSAGGRRARVGGWAACSRTRRARRARGARRVRAQAGRGAFARMRAGGHAAERRGRTFKTLSSAPRSADTASVCPALLGVLMLPRFIAVSRSAEKVWTSCLRSCLILA